ncbi:MAG: four helix bundle protein [Christiangramia sp.]|nr:four helix bundle protein [Christiangramia sp.]
MKNRSNEFAHKCVKTALSLPSDYPGSHIRSQLVRCATSVAANYRAALLGQTKKSFIAKLSIVIEEADECIFWIEFLLHEGLLNYEECEEVLKEAKELTAIFISSRKTAEQSEKRS